MDSVWSQRNEYFVSHEHQSIRLAHYLQLLQHHLSSQWKRSLDLLASDGRQTLQQLHNDLQLANLLLLLFKIQSSFLAQVGRSSKHLPCAPYFQRRMSLRLFIFRKPPSWKVPNKAQLHSMIVWRTNGFQNPPEIGLQNSDSKQYFEESRLPRYFDSSSFWKSSLFNHWITFRLLNSRLKIRAYCAPTRPSSLNRIILPVTCLDIPHN